jgi:hypothetical protein
MDRIDMEMYKILLPYKKKQTLLSSLSFLLLMQLSTLASTPEEKDNTIHNVKNDNDITVSDNENENNNDNNYDNNN